MNKILVISGNQALKNLLTNQQEFEFIFIDDQEKIEQFVDDSQNWKNGAITLLIIDHKISSQQFCAKFALPKNLPVISLLENAGEALPIKNLTILTKPFKIIDLLAIITNIITNQEPKIINYKNCQINFQTRTVCYNQNEIKLTELESNLLKYLIEHSQNISKNELLIEVWKVKNLENINDTGVVEAAFNKLKKKLKELGNNHLLTQIQLAFQPNQSGHKKE
jgi:DNA-binding response OmpR family regulator